MGKRGWLYVSSYNTEEELASAIEDHFDGEDIGAKTFIVSVHGGIKNGLPYWSLGVDVVWLCTGELCFRMSSESTDGDWAVGSCEEAAAFAWELAQPTA